MFEQRFLLLDEKRNTIMESDKETLLSLRKGKETVWEVQSRQGHFNMEYCWMQIGG